MVTNLRYLLVERLEDLHGLNKELWCINWALLSNVSHLPGELTLNMMSFGDDLVVLEPHWCCWLLI